ncbi:glycerophosphoryl diester phosphodiesterase membrane domain-containing protein [Mycobacterium sp. 1274761.0]|uniref:glycerophosphoryl diester phosphodiesterase membrane domain-containing protein n=1 Tax=Mycobacterium sp. 1274761.0 TaxID=1834077 RepID=UPI000B28B552|nr:glycerophosphoryl diester phosphodiesterase membrane domain-containing protein [Mycobacterium sp. 1274761.0]
MSNPGYPPPGYPAGYQPYPPPGYQGYPPPGYPGYPPPGFSAPPYGPPAFKPGVIPLRPLSLTDILNGAFSYIRTNPKATLGLTTIVVVIAQLIGLVLQIGPLAAMGELGVLRGQEGSTAAMVGESASNIASTVTTLLSSIVLSGMLTVIVGRAVFGATISIGEAWQRVRGRLWPLFGFMALWLLAVAVPIFVVGFVIIVAASLSGAVAFVIAIPLVLSLIALLVYLWTVLSFAPPLIVLERLGVFPAIKRSVRLIKGDFWRVLGIRLVATLVAGIVAAAVAIPFSLVGQLMLVGSESTATIPLALVLVAIGGAVAQIITAPFSAGAVVLIYTDRRMRAEAFDLVLQTGAAPGAAPDSTDHLWLTRQP